MYGEVAAGVAVVAQGSVRVQGEVGDGTLSIKNLEISGENLTKISILNGEGEDG